MDVLKRLNEARNAKIDEINTKLRELDPNTAWSKAQEEEYNALNEEVAAYERQIKAVVSEQSRALSIVNTDNKDEVKKFDGFIREYMTGKRAVDAKNNAAIIPNKILNMVITRIKEISPLANMVQTFVTNGDLTIPQFGLTENDVTIGLSYVPEGEVIPTTDAKFKGLVLKSHVFGTIVLVSEQMIADTDFPLVAFIVDYLATEAAAAIENILINGVTSKGSTIITGAVDCAAQKTTAAAGTVTADELIDLQMSLPQACAQNSIWVINAAAMGKIRKLKDDNKNYLFTVNNGGSYLYNLLDRPAYVSENVPATVAALVIDPSGMTLKFSKTIEVKALMERYADYNQIGLRTTMHMDAGINNQQKIACLKYHA